MDFADDIALLDEDSESAKSHLSSVMKQASHVGLKVNMPKTKCMAFPPLTTGITLDNGIALDEVQEFKYLGSLMSSALNDLNA